MGQYTKKGLYNGYKKNNTEREKLDYYATPTEQVVNILNILDINFDNKTIIDPQCGGGHMIEGIIQYCDNKEYVPKELIGTDIKDRGYKNDNVTLEYGLDFLYDDYKYDSVDIVVMNPPYSTIEPCVIRALEIANDYLIMLGRLQFIEGQKRYNTILKDYPPTYIYQYVDRVSCLKNGNPASSSAQAYAWFIWDMKDSNTNAESILRWMRRSND